MCSLVLKKIRLRHFSFRYVANRDGYLSIADKNDAQDNILLYYFNYHIPHIGNTQNCIITGSICNVGLQRKY